MKADYSNMLEITFRSQPSNVWDYIRVGQDNKYLIFHKDTTRISATHIHDILCTNWIGDYVENNPESYCPTEPVGGWLFTTSNLQSDFFLCDKQKWKNNGGFKRVNKYPLLRGYFHLEGRPDHTKVVYKTTSQFSGVYRGFVIYFQPLYSDPLIINTKPHGNAKHTSQPFVRFSRDRRRKIEEYALKHKRDKPLQVYYDINSSANCDAALVPTARDPKQIQNMRQRTKNPSGAIDELTELADRRRDVIQMFSYHPNRCVVLISNLGLKMLKRFKIWKTDTTFNIENV
jgi:hypothetical protein